MTSRKPHASPISSERLWNVESDGSEDTFPSSVNRHRSSSSQDSSDTLVPENDDTRSNDVSIAHLARHPSMLENDEQQPTAAALAANTSSSYKTKDEPVTWMSLPKKGQLAVLTLARLSEPLSERSLSAYMFYQLRSFDKSLPDSTIASQGGTLTAAFAAAQFVTAIWWGRVADSPRVGRKNVLLIGLLGTAIASIGVGFSRSFAQALTCRLIAGALNGNVGVMRTMISEMIEERKFQSRAFLLLPMCFNIGVVIGPIMGGFLADPIHSFPGVFGTGSLLGGKNGVKWMNLFPYALPNIVSCVLISISALGVFFGLDETHSIRRHRPDWGRKTGKWLARAISRRKDPAYDYRQLQMEDTELQPTPTTPTTNHNIDVEQSPHQKPLAQPALLQPKPYNKSPFRRIMTRNVVFTLASHHLMALHISTFNALIFLFLPSPRATTNPSHFTLSFTGGLGLSSEKVGLATAIIGIIGFPLQILLYPSLNQKLGTLAAYKWFLPFSAVAYTLLPFLALLPDKAYLIWPSLTVVLAAQVLARTFALPSTVILVNNSSPGPEVLGTVHGVAQSVSSAARMLGPTVGGWGLGEGLSKNCVGAVWWAMTVVVGLNWALLWGVFEGDGRGGRA